MKPLILISNDDGVDAPGLKVLTEVAREFGDVVVMAPRNNASCLSHSLTTQRPLRVYDVKQEDGLEIYCCDGTPADCVKLAVTHFCPQKPDLVLSGINHGSNSSINVLYSGTMGAAIEASVLGFNAIGFSLLSHNHQTDLTPCIPYARKITGYVLEHGLPEFVSLNVNIPHIAAEQIKGIRICHEAKAQWLDSFEERVDPRGQRYWWLTGKFLCENPDEGSDEWALTNGYVSVVPVSTDFTNYKAIDNLKQLV